MRLARSRASLAVGAAALVGVAAVVVLVMTVSDGDDPSTPDPTATIVAGRTATPTQAAPAARIVDCPLEREICDFAVQAEAWVRAGDAESLIADGSAWDNANDIGILRTSIERSLYLTAWPVRVTTIGCPHSDGATSCAEAFSLSFTTLSRHERNQPGNTSGVLTLGFQRKGGAQPALTLVGNPAAVPDDFVYALTGGLSLSCNLSGLPERTEGECINTEFFAVEVERRVVAGQPRECPALPVVCETALETEAALRDKEYAAVAGTGDYALKAAIEAVFGSETPRLISVACPFGNVRATCDGPFAVAFTTLKPEDDWTVGGKMALVRFNWTAAGPVFNDVFAVEPVAAREAAIVGTIYGGTCGIAGVMPGNPCPAATFVRYWSTEPFVPAGLPDVVTLTFRTAIAPPPNTTIFTAAGPCWACDTPDEAIQKHVVDAAGNVTTTSVLDATLPLLAGWGMGQSAYATPDGSMLAVTACRGGYCGALGSEKPVADWRVLWSFDGGEMWSVAFSARSEYMSISNMTSVGLTVTVFDFDPTAAAKTQHYVVLRGEAPREVVPPPGLGERPGLVLLGDGKLAWVPLQDGHVVGGLRDLDGNRYPLDIPAGAENPVFGVLVDGRTWANWNDYGPKLGIFNGSGKLEAVYDAGEGFRPSVVSASVGIATISLRTGDGSVPAILDLKAATITPLGDPFGTAELPRRNRILAVIEYQ